MVPFRKNKITVGIILINIALFLYDALFIGPFFDNASLIRAGAGMVSLIQNGEYYRLLSAGFLHSGTQHLVNNMLLLYVMGSILESEIGMIRYAALYLAGVLLSSYGSYRYYLLKGEDVIFVGASGAVFALIGAVLFLSILYKGRFADYSTRQLLSYIVFSLIYGFTTEGIGNAAHIIGLVSGFVMAMLFFVTLRKRKLIDRS